MAVSRAALCAALAAALAASIALAVRAQAPAAVNTTPSRENLEQAARDGCDNASVVVQRCLPQPNSGAPETRPPADELTRSRERAQAAFDRRARQQQKDALDRKPGNPRPAVEGPGDAQRLAPVTVTGTATENPPPPEEVLQKALNPQTSVLPNGNSVTYGPDGDRTECQAHCVGPMCCKVIRARPNPARLSNAIGQ